MTAQETTDVTAQLNRSASSTMEILRQVTAGQLGYRPHVLRGMCVR